MNETVISQENASILSLSQHRVSIPHEIQDHLRRQYKHLKVEIDIASNVRKQVESQSNLAKNDVTSSEVQIVKDDHFSRILSSMKTAPKVTICRVNLILVEDIEKVLQDINEYLVHLFDEDCKRTEDEFKNSGDNQPKVIKKSVLFKARKHDIFHDVIEIYAAINGDDSSSASSSVDEIQSLSSYSKLPPQICHGEGIFSHWPSRQKSDFPVHYKVIICDRFCGEAVLRGSNIFVRGVIAADRNVECGDHVCVYAHVSSDSIPRGLTIENYHCGQHTCVFLGLGKAECTRAQMFNQSAGLAVTMFNNIMHSSKDNVTGIEFSTKAGPLLPSMNGILSNKIMLQNLPSILVAHALNPRRKDVIVDLCCAPGGKTSHVASLVNNDAIIVAIDKSRKKMKSVKKFFDDMGASCITPLALDSTKCVLTVNENHDETWKSVKEILSVASCNDDGLLDVKGFYPESFDKIVLDPPCSG